MVHLFVGKDDKLPAISKYAGRGKLASWVQVTAVRIARRQLSKAKRHQPNEVDVLVDCASEMDGPELQALKDKYRAQFKDAFKTAFAALTTRQRNVLRHELLDGLNIDKIGTIYGVHRATVARWRTAARQALTEEIRRIFTEEHRVSDSEFDTIMRLIRSRLELSLPRSSRLKKK